MLRSNGFYFSVLVTVSFFSIRADGAQAATTQTVTLKANQDVYIRKNHQSSNYDGTKEGLEFGSKTSSKGQYRNLINWDLSAIPKKADVVSAAITIHVWKKVCAGKNCLPEGDLDLYRVTAAWKESEATWSRRMKGKNWKKPGSDHDATRVATQHVINTSRFEKVDYTYDVTALVKGWVNGTFPAYGVMGMIRDADNTTVWVGGAHNGAWFPPCELKVTFTAGKAGKP